ncbi:hypothetical protein CDCA_CDCA11G3125 [Cyanidium caldarium]|uniref:Ion transport domain-containing protein n=1 Tax=Cyanidium caldarium TaxID=2771 RepID=A0AAV9IYD1_CYACA|nr:hypothetical protein CDCA_CDCA11G3125 [Cyanidium caldarium]
MERGIHQFDVVGEVWVQHVGLGLEMRTSKRALSWLSGIHPTPHRQPRRPPTTASRAICAGGTVSWTRCNTPKRCQRNIPRWKRAFTSWRAEHRGGKADPQSPTGSEAREAAPESRLRDVDPSAPRVSDTAGSGDDGASLGLLHRPLPFAEQLDRALNSPAYELVLTALVIAVSALYAVETLPQLSAEWRTILERAEAIISGAFVVEYLLRFYSQNLDPRYLLKKAMLIDFVSIVPLFVVQRLSPDAFEFGFVRLLRVIRILRLERLVEEDTFRNFFLGRADTAYAEFKLRIAQIVFAVASIIWVTSGLIYDAEHAVNPQFQTYFDALYFSIVALTTVGLGDVAPRTPLGKLVISVAILVGVAVIPFQLGQLGRALFAQSSTSSEADAANEDEDDSRRPLRMARVACPRCGARGHLIDARYCRICAERLASSDNGTARADGAPAAGQAAPTRAPDNL